MNLQTLGSGLECIKDLNSLLSESHGMRSNPLYEDNDKVCEILDRISDMTIELMDKIEGLDFDDSGARELESYIGIAMNFMHIASLIIARINGEEPCSPKKRGRRTKSR